MKLTTHFTFAEFMNLCLHTNFGEGKDDCCGALSCQVPGLFTKINVPALSAVFVKPSFPNTRVKLTAVLFAGRVMAS